MNYSAATLFLEGWFHAQWADRTLISYESGNLPLPENRPLATEDWLRFSVSGVGAGMRSAGRGEPWRRWQYLASIQIFCPLHTGHDVTDSYVSTLLTLWQNLDLIVPEAGARWLLLDEIFPPQSRRDREWFQTNVVTPLQLEWRS